MGRATLPGPETVSAHHQCKTHAAAFRQHSPRGMGDGGFASRLAIVFKALSQTPWV